jgi:hypothetical protein
MAADRARGAGRAGAAGVGRRPPSGGLRDLDAERERGVSEASVVAVQAFEVIAEAHDGCQLQGIERPQLSWIQLGGPIEDLLIERDECDGGQGSASASGGQFAVASGGAASLDGEQDAADELSARQLVAQGTALGLGAHELDEGRRV